VPGRPEVRFNLENPLEGDQKEMQINSAPKPIPTHKIDVKDCVETINEWGGRGGQMEAGESG
jgi:hypothetical protein